MSRFRQLKGIVHRLEPRLATAQDAQGVELHVTLDDIALLLEAAKLLLRRTTALKPRD